MAVRRDQVLIQRAVMRSAETAIVGDHPARSDRPPRRFGAAAGGSIIIAVVALTVVAATALLTGDHGRAATAAGVSPAPVASAAGLPQPSGDPSAPPGAPASSSVDWRRPGVLFVEQSTGKTYVYVSGRLRPSANVASSDLILGTSRPTRVAISYWTVAGANPGPTIGIAGAPSLPQVGTMLGGELAICSVSGQATASVVFPSAAGYVDDTGYVDYDGLAGGNGLSTNALVVSNRGADYLVWNRVRYPISDPAEVFGAYKWTGVVAVPVPDDLLAALPGGAAISPTALALKPPKPLHLGAPATLCVSVDRAGHAVHTVINPTVTTKSGTFALPATGAMLVKASAGAATVDLIMAPGTYFPIVGRSALDSLGYGSAPVSIAPSSVLALLTAGPTLSRQAALN